MDSTNGKPHSNREKPRLISAGFSQLLNQLANLNSLKCRVLAYRAYAEHSLSFLHWFWQKQCAPMANLQSHNYRLCWILLWLSFSLHLTPSSVCLYVCNYFNLLLLLLLVFSICSHFLVMHRLCRILRLESDTESHRELREFSEKEPMICIAIQISDLITENNPLYSALSNLALYCNFELLLEIWDKIRYR